MKDCRRNSFAFLLLALALLVSGCAGTVKNMREVAPGAAAGVPDPGKAVVVFMRPSGLGYAVQSSVYEVKGETPSLVGIVAAKTKVAYRVDPGRHLFMTVGESADFMTADIQAGKTYYVDVTPRIGMWKARFSLDPKRAADLAGNEFKSNFDECRWVELGPESALWFRENLPSINAKRTEYYAEWLKKPESERPHLRAEDGR